MIDEKDRKIIQDIVGKYKIPTVVLFGSSLSGENEARDIDIAIEGIASSQFFAFYGELLCALSKPVDVIDLSGKSKFNELIMKNGIRLDA
ncbi:MAG: nucleotidyltransferase domain-containing protein [Thiomicrorhabdus sp.]|jgi:predicted nucleotidyltransferase|nr:nucleotidyltransferase domain-containing protein [Thiomicrorhabdus sp.]